MIAPKNFDASRGQSAGELLPLTSYQGIQKLMGLGQDFADKLPKYANATAAKGT
jgi:hypothetical protein